MITADDRKGGYAYQTFNITKIHYIVPLTVSYLDLIIVSSVLGGIILAAIIFLCAKNATCKSCRKNKSTNEDNDSFEEDDDICVDDAKPKNPFTLQKEL